MFTYRGVTCDTVEELAQLQQAFMLQDFVKLPKREQFAKVDQLIAQHKLEEANKFLTYMEPREQKAQARLNDCESKRKQSEEKLRLAREDRDINSRLKWDLFSKQERETASRELLIKLGLG